MLLQKIRNEERISKPVNALGEQLQEKDKIIRTNQKKILLLGEKHNEEVKDVNDQQEMMNEKVEQNDIGIKKHHIVLVKER
ncbi:uncharacterized protein MONOS_12713 [Monocercomonoides exilis]|uniref:uncharacterized protein n=1 Tax=Monocercomonoides exilis TaxID=2049356 RepID=UPI00355A2D68|nr:hypothetical protein MONOS_12713 [Monocercomonoides exilis]|eukprot:MONOS_12713.1-p1 / transcript=MONOS_12713.1 / gene=MONOS_12713 / organism=Monocercomonoides_exilis_PA203 / gene_product=unspecified product / transcript_product=unspecified product / location=Mono_scaffold00723:24337-24579(-) / protein_length=81 / sequence_SO=supercontig / SO=protein_coding / is_pseudo=false